MGSTYSYHDASIIDLKTSGWGNVIIGHSPHITTLILELTHPKFDEIYSKIELNQPYTIKYKYRHDRLYLEDLMEPRIYRMKGEIINFLDISKEIDSEIPVYQLIFSKVCDKRIVTLNKNNEFQIGFRYTIEYTLWRDVFYKVKYYLATHQYM